MRYIPPSMSRLKASSSISVLAAAPLTGRRARTPGKGRPERDWLLTRLCPGCGYAGHELQARGDKAVYMCPCCATDLYARPARSYAEMEGIIDASPAPAVRTRLLSLDRLPRGRRLWRWVRTYACAHRR